MPTIRFKDKNGNCFILYGQTASWGVGNFNDPKTADVAPEDLSVCNRCSNSLTVNTAQGPVTIYFNLNGRTGACNQCGVCCSHLISACTHGKDCGFIVSGQYHICQHLQIKAPGIGKKNGTACGIWNRLLYEGYKSCVTWPSEKFEIAPYPNCGFRFP